MMRIERTACFIGLIKKFEHTFESNFEILRSFLDFGFSHLMLSHTRIKKERSNRNGGILILIKF
jgi:hypothetical protein